MVKAVRTNCTLSLDHLAIKSLEIQSGHTRYLFSVFAIKVTFNVHKKFFNPTFRVAEVQFNTW